MDIAHLYNLSQLLTFTGYELIINNRFIHAIPKIKHTPDFYIFKVDQSDELIIYLPITNTCLNKEQLYFYLYPNIDPSFIKQNTKTIEQVTLTKNPLHSITHSFELSTLTQDAIKFKFHTQQYISTNEVKILSIDQTKYIPFSINKVILPNPLHTEHLPAFCYNDGFFLVSNSTNPHLNLIHSLEILHYKNILFTTHITLLTNKSLNQNSIPTIEDFIKSKSIHTLTFITDLFHFSLQSTIHSIFSYLNEMGKSKPLFFLKDISNDFIEVVYIFALATETAQKMQSLKTYLGPTENLRTLYVSQWLNNKRIDHNEEDTFYQKYYRIRYTKNELNGFVTINYQIPKNKTSVESFFNYILHKEDLLYISLNIIHI